MSEETKTKAGAVQAPAEKKKLAKAKARKKKGKVVNIPVANVYIQATYNNTLITVTDPQGNTLGWSSAGHMGFKGPKKSTPYAAGLVIKDLAERLGSFGIKEVNVFIKGIGSGRDGALRALYANGFSALSIKDITPIPHNGCRPCKVRRV
ncbi:MAG: 30S ribosomal protein S11 [Candidatus Magasanikbacteria bacterium GW2011_GWA2_45_39]|uniref:Small ribosomal subunit protein uS11 n=2 Tax=Candidatus Magasanikiibacteriota TaxID=1752731 RepID=A0A0G1N0W0_9BACT|nr:MAG: 30S ribosomal protein S11 [Candidatus Magasanikbacteria bacterium GW2011_GWA2_45_39]KKU14109.1 MAG: 30S ribosomal protein S11 [Candidatus Magasanikbacteria bacterium GW2011_GWC2_45_8]